jgi:hypothetical protein
MRFEHHSELGADASSIMADTALARSFTPITPFPPACQILAGRFGNLSRTECHGDFTPGAK